MTLISHGYVVPSIAQDGCLDRYDLSVTEIGLAWASGEDHVPEDAAGYVARCVRPSHRSIGLSSGT